MKLKRSIYFHNASQGDGTYRRLPFKGFVVVVSTMFLVAIVGISLFFAGKDPVNLSEMHLEEIRSQNEDLTKILAELNDANKSVEKLIDSLKQTEGKLLAIVPQYETTKSEIPLESKLFSLPLIQSYSDTLMQFLKDVAISSGPPKTIWNKIPVLFPLATKQAAVSRPFGVSKNPFTGVEKMNPGCNYASAKGTKVIATAAGVVKKSYYDKLWGYRVVISHGNGVSTIYSHLKALDIPVGRSVKKGSVIGEVGSSGWALGTGIHYQIIKDNTPIDPERIIVSGL